MAAKKIKLSDTMKKDIKPSESDQVIKQSEVLTLDKRIESICERFDQDSGDYRYPKVGSYSGFISGFQNPSKSISSCCGDTIRTERVASCRTGNGGRQPINVRPKYEQGPKPIREQDYLYPFFYQQSC